MANRWGKCESSDRFHLVLWNHCGWWLQPWNQKTIASQQESYDKPRGCVEKQRHYSANKGPYSQAMVFPVVMYVCESWTIKKVECRRIDVFKLWCWSRLLRVPWTARSNQSILRVINPEYSLEGLMPTLKLQYFGFLMRTTDSSEKFLMLGKNEGRRGPQRMRCLDGIIDAMDVNLGKLREMVKNREAWCAVVHGVAKRQTHWATHNSSRRFAAAVLCPLSSVWLFATPWTVACQDPLSLEFSRQEFWSRLPIFYSRGSSRPRYWTCISCTSCFGRQILYHWAAWNDRTKVWECLIKWKTLPMVKQEKTLSTGESFLKLWWLKSITNNIKTAYIHWNCKFDLLFQLWYNTYIIYHFNYFKCTEGSSTFTLLCSVHHCASPELLILKDETLDLFEDWEKKYLKVENYSLFEDITKDFGPEPLRRLWGTVPKKLGMS